MTGVVLHDSMPVRAVPWVPSGRAGSVFGSRVTCPTSSASPPARDRGSDACRLTGLVPVPSTPSSWPARIYLGALDQQLLGSGGTDLHVLYSVRDVGAYPLMSRRDILPHDPGGFAQCGWHFLLLWFWFLGCVRSHPSRSRATRPSAMQISLCARSTLGACPLRSDRTASCWRPTSVAARLGLQLRCFRCASTKSASRRLTGPVGFVFICASPSVFSRAADGLLCRSPVRTDRLLCLRSLPSSTMHVGVPEPSSGRFARRFFDFSCLFAFSLRSAYPSATLNRSWHFSSRWCCRSRFRSPTRRRVSEV